MRALSRQNKTAPLPHGILACVTHDPNISSIHYFFDSVFLNAVAKKMKVSD
jgi:hypothetical protein